MDLHPDIEQLSFLIGTWRGHGHGIYPTIEDFDYDEEISFTALPGKPVILYSQRTRRATTGEPLHSETGYFRCPAPGRVELALAQPTGILEAHAGSVDGTHLHLRVSEMALTPTAKEVTDVERHIEVDGDRMRYRLSMAAVGHSLQIHLEAKLTRL